MTFGVEDLAYTCDIDALNKKINVLAETTHTNDALMMSIQDTYTTVDEVNEVLTNYALKSDMDRHVEDLYEQIADLIDSQQNKYYELSSTIARNNNENQKAHENFVLKSEMDKYVSTNTFSDYITTANDRFFHASQMNTFTSSINKRFATKTELEEENTLELKTLIQSLVERITRLENKILSE